MSEDIRNCPFCDGDAILQVRDFTDADANFGMASIFCGGCFVEQPWHVDENQAINAWNYRESDCPI